MSDPVYLDDQSNTLPPERKRWSQAKHLVINTEKARYLDDMLRRPDAYAHIEQVKLGWQYCQYPDAPFLAALSGLKQLYVDGPNTLTTLDALASLNHLNALALMNYTDMYPDSNEMSWAGKLPTLQRLFVSEPFLNGEIWSCPPSLQAQLTFLCMPMECFGQQHTFNFEALDTLVLLSMSHWDDLEPEEFQHPPLGLIQTLADDHSPSYDGFTNLFNQLTSLTSLYLVDGPETQEGQLAMASCLPETLEPQTITYEQAQSLWRNGTV